MLRWLMVGTGLAAASMLASGCASTCSANPEKLAALQRGMSYAEATRVMGCEGLVISPHDPSSGEVSTVEWNGPGSILAATRLDFRDGQLLYYTTRTRGGL